LKQVAIAGISFPVVVFSTWFEAAIINPTFLVVADTLNYPSGAK